MTNQVNTLINQDVMLDLYKIHAYIPNDAAGNPLTPFGNFCEGYQAATKASESEINALKEQVNELQSHLSSQSLEIANYDVTLESYAHKVAELQADNNKLREALSIAMLNGDYLRNEKRQLNKVLASTSSQSLAEHDNDVIERIATALENADGEFKTLPEYVSLVRALKATP